MQSELEFGQRHLNLPEYSSKVSLACGSIEQVVIERGQYLVTGCREKSPKCHEIDIADCRFNTVSLHVGKRRAIDTELPCVFTQNFCSEFRQKLRSIVPFLGEAY